MAGDEGDEGDENVRSPDERRLDHWHEEMCAELGVPDTLARLVVFYGIPAADLRRLIRDKGCPPDLAVRILRP